MKRIWKWLGGLPCRFGWHAPDYGSHGYDGASWHVRCGRCGFKGMLDSQGNLF